MKSIRILLSAFLSALTAAAAVPPRNDLPASEWAMVRQTAVNYGLSDDATWLLAAIRRHENGRAGLEFGIGGPMDSGHPAHRFRDGVKSFYVQAAWAAGTVRRHYRGDVYAFARHYNPKSPDRWAVSISTIVRRLKAANNNALPGKKPAKRAFDFLK